MKFEMLLLRVPPSSLGWIRNVYKRHNPAEMQQVESMLQKYRGMEAELYHRVCEKYGEQPEDVG